MGEAKHDFYSISEYLTLERTSDIRHEYHNGKVYAMSGGTINHGIIGSNINAELNRAIKKAGKGCTSISNDVRIRIKGHESFVYPDAMVVCGEIESAEDDEHSITNPTIVVEVVSKSSVKTDNEIKSWKYRSLDSLQEYVIIQQNIPILEIISRNDSGEWTSQYIVGLEESFHLKSIDAEISMRDIFQNARDLEDPFKDTIKE